MLCSDKRAKLWTIVWTNICFVYCSVFQWMLEFIFQKIDGFYAKTVNSLRCKVFYSDLYIHDVGVTKGVPEFVREEARRRHKGCRSSE